tara:strand:+ start:339 stop:737 length:399 start_codon:yes stop_codon:yes gene_type:complete
MLNFIVILIVLTLNFKAHSNDGGSALDLFINCKNYNDWVNGNFKDHVDDKTLFNMGKCQGIIETTGKTMLTLCYERKRNLNISKKLVSNLEGVKTMDIIKEFIKFSKNRTDLQNYSYNSYLIDFISINWPCK